MKEGRKGTYKLDPVAFSTWSSKDELDAVNHDAIICDGRWRMV